MGRGATIDAGTAKLKLKTLLGNHDWTRPLRSDASVSNLFELEFDGSAEASAKFKPMIRELAYDCGELAIVTYLQAKYYGKPFVLLPLVLLGGFHHKSLAYNSHRGVVTPQSLAGKRVGVKSYSQTTGLWVRAILQHEYEVELGRINFVTFEDAHLSEYRDPKNCVRAPSDRKLIDMFLGGDELDAAIMGGNMPNDPGVKPVVADPGEAAKRWAAKYGVTPINHMLVATKPLCERRPDVVRSLFNHFADAAASRKADFPNGLDGNWTALQLASDYAYEQGIVPRRYTVDELFADARQILKSPH